MSVRFPSTEFFEALKKHVETDPDCMGSVAECEAYCGFQIGNRLTVVEFDGKQCVAVVNGGNPIDLDFVISGAPETWHDLISAISKNADVDEKNSLRALLKANSLEIQTEAPDGESLADAALDFLQAFLEQAKSLEIEFE